MMRIQMRTITYLAPTIESRSKQGENSQNNRIIVCLYRYSTKNTCSVKQNRFKYLT